MRAVRVYLKLHLHKEQHLFKRKLLETNSYRKFRICISASAICPSLSVSLQIQSSKQTSNLKKYNPRNKLQI